MSRRKAVVIAYDVRSDKRRRKLFRCLQSWHLDKQYSLFECLLTQQEAEELFLQLEEILDNGEDSLMLAWLDNRRAAKGLTKNAQVGFNQPLWYMG